MDNNMNQKKIMIKGPILSRSGYGEHLRDFLNSLINIYEDSFKYQVIVTNWGHCTDVSDNKYINQLLDKVELINPNTLNLKYDSPDIFIDCNVGGSLEVLPKSFNIGLTAGIETDKVCESWVKKLEKIDLLIVPSKHSKDAYIKTIKEMYNKEKNKDDEKKNEIKIKQLINKIHIIFEGLNLDLYNNDIASDYISDERLHKIMTNKNNIKLLSVGQWTNGQIFHERKNISSLIATYLKFMSTKKANTNGKKVYLILKTNSVNFSNTFLYRLKSDIKKIYKIIKANVSEKDWDILPKIMLLHGELTYPEMQYLYKHSDAYISLTHGEGFGRPFLEFAATGKPILAPNYSGYLDFIHKDKYNDILIDGKMIPIHQSVKMNNIIPEDGKWIYCENKEIDNAYRKLLEEKIIKTPISKEKIKYIKENFSIIKMEKIIKRVFDKFVLKNKKFQTLLENKVNLELPNFD